MMRYPLDATRLAEIQRQIAARDAAADAAKSSASSEPHVTSNAALGPAE